MSRRTPSDDDLTTVLHACLQIDNQKTFLKTWQKESRRIGLLYWRTKWLPGPLKKGGRTSLQSEFFAAFDAVWAKWASLRPKLKTNERLIEEALKHLASQRRAKGSKQNTDKYSKATGRKYLIPYYRQTKTPIEVSPSWLRRVDPGKTPGEKGKHIPQQFGLWRYQVQEAWERLCTNPDQMERWIERLEITRDNPHLPQSVRDGAKALMARLDARNIPH